MQIYKLYIYQGNGPYKYAKNINSHKILQKNIDFGANIHAPELNYCPNDFFIKIPELGKSLKGVNKIIEATAKATVMISEQNSFDNVLKFIAESVGNANSKLRGYGLKNKITHSGILRTKREGWDYKATWENN